MNLRPLLLYMASAVMQLPLEADSKLRPVVEDRCGVFALCVCAESIGTRTSNIDVGSHMPNLGSNASLAELERAAEQVGLAAIAIQWRGNPVPFDVASTPAIIPVVNLKGKRHFLAVLASRGDQLLVMDFPKAATWVLTSDLRARWKWEGHALHLATEPKKLSPLAPQQSSWAEMLFFGALFAAVICLWVPVARRHMMPTAFSASSNRSGMTIVELLVAISIVGLLAALLLPAIQAARERAHQMECGHRLKQLGLAVANYESTHRQLPPMHSSLLYLPSGKFDRQNLSLQARLLPELDEAAVFQRIDLNEDGKGAVHQPPSSRFNPSLLTQRIQAFECPSENVTPGGISYRFPIENSGGVFAPPRRGRRVAEYHDGTSSTILFAEKLLGDRRPGSYVPWRDIVPMPYRSLKTLDIMAQTCEAAATPNSPDWSYGGASWLFSSFQMTCYNHAATPNSHIADCQNDQIPSKFAAGVITARSLHAGGVNVAFVDGSIRFISNSVDLKTWRALGTAADGEIAIAY
jgi:prepilin-type N-terminal cleavage/methylation domain-containing protein/prepilin-type processing-associated H-X9-DG protein